MENSWQMKCGSSTQSMASFTSQEPRNQMETDSGRYFYPHLTHDLRSTMHGRMQDPMSPNIRNINSCRLGHTELGNSFLALLSGPPTLLQCDFQELPNLKAISASSSKLPIDGGVVNISAVGSGVLPTAGGLLSEHYGNPNVQNGANICPVVSSGAVLNNNFSGKPILHDGRQAANLCLQTSDLTKAVIHQLVPSNEKAKDFSSVKGKWQSTSSATVGKLCTSNIPTSQKVPPATNYSISSQSSSLTSVCPRVFCLGASGDLLLSNTGLLGIVCSCHHFRMSVAKFCEHLGLREVNPGFAVQMENGETIAQWRKLYFQKFGIRVPDDQSGWDWPEALSGTAGLVKSGVVVPNVSKNSDLAKLADLSRGGIKSGQLLDNIVFSKNLHTDQHLVVDMLHDKEQRCGQDNDNHRLKGLINTLQSNLLAVPITDNQIIECPMSSCLTSLKFADRGPDIGFQPSISAYTDSESSKTFGENYDVSKTKNGSGAVTADKVAVSSNIELRLGQPYQQCPSSGNSVPSVINPMLLDTLVGPSKSHFLGQIVHNATNCGEKVHSRQFFQCSAGPSNLSARREQSQLNIGNDVYGISTVMDTDKLEQFEGKMTGSCVVPFLSHFHTPPEMSANCKNHNNVDKCDHIMPKPLHCESHTAKSNHVSIPWNVGFGSERQLNASESGFFRLKDKGKGVGCIADGSYAMKDSEFKIQKQVKSPGSFTGAVSGSTVPCFSAIHDKSHFFQQSSARPPDVFDAKNLDHPEKLPFLGSSAHVDHVFLRSAGPAMGSGQNLESQLLSMVIPSPTSTSIPGMSPTISKLEDIGVSPHLLDDNMRLLALRQILELSKQQHTLSSLGMDQDKVRLGSVSNANVQPQLVESSTFREQRFGPNVTSQLNHSEAAMMSSPLGAYTRLRINVEKSASVTGLNNFCDFSTVGQGNALLSREIDLQCQFPQDPLLNRQLLFSGNVAPSSEHAKCCKEVPCSYFQGNNGCAAYTKCWGGNCEARVGSSLNNFKEQLENVNDEMSMLAASEFVKGDIGTKEKTISFDQIGKLKGQLPKTLVCHASQWRDVPSKFKGACDMTCLDQSTDVFNERGHIESQHGDKINKCSHGTMKIPYSLKEQEISNVSSGCSAAAVTQASIQVNNMDSSVVDVGNARNVNDHVVDEGSGIDKCWSSDDACESERSAEFLGSNCKTNFSNEGSSKVLNNQSSRSLLDELKLIDSLTWKRSWKQFHTRLTVHGKGNVKNIERGFKTGKRKRARKFKILEGPFPAADPSVAPYEHCKYTGAFAPSSTTDVEMLHPSVRETCVSGSWSLRHNSKCGRSTFSSTKECSRKRDLCMIYGDRDGQGDHQMELSSDANFTKVHDFSGTKKLKRLWTSDCIRKSHMEEPTQADSKNTVRCKSVGCVKVSSSCEGNISYGKARPVVCGKYGEISSGKLTGDVSQPVKIVSLSRILKAARRCTVSENCKPKPSIPTEFKLKCFCGSDVGCNALLDSHKREDCSIHHASINEMNIDPFVEEDKICTDGDKLFADEKSIWQKESDNKGKKNGCTLNCNVRGKLKSKCKEIRKRSLLELTERGRKFGSESFSLTKVSKHMPKMKVQKILKNAERKKHHVGGSRKVNAEIFNHEQRPLSIMDSDAFCCVCGGSNKDEINCLLECSRCFIKVHQACYGVSRVPKSHWYCRPCRTSSKDIVCVLCGYGGGAMTRALRSRTIVKSLLKAWNVETECRSKNTAASAEIMEDDLNVLHSHGSSLEGNTFPVSKPVNIESPTASLWKVDMQNQSNIVQNSSFCVSNMMVHNSIIAGVLDSTVKQWVHMVCGLWTPGTRCPNVDTMSAFDVSGASRHKANVVCSMCKRPGGSCIQCRVVNCSVQFHPWCAHQKGLLQSEVEGVDNENVGFYGRCVLHATQLLCDSDSDPINIEVEKELTCARTEGYKGRQRDGFCYNLYGQSRGKSGCLVPQEQLNAWIHINGQKSCTKGLSKLPVSDIENDCRKEYARYKQSKGWKHLVVYKSGIHALGLYTSRFISRGEMVVEYVGEIVGQRVADKRENEYQSGRKLQYKSACYFFRIDKEHIIDATCKGGIARFVNHSCLPNCVAKVISVRNEKKVVFFAERDINPGEEITYDYHFNHEDEGKKIPCFCNSKNCRRYLN